ncbi:MAG: hypothetical protein RL758_587 [Pseudomonadota bacterium]
MHARYLPHRLWVALALALLAFVGSVQGTRAEDLSPQQAEDIKKGLRQINAQIVRLRTVTVQADQSQMVQSQAIQKQIEGIALSHSRLVEQLMALQADSEQQIEHLAQANQKLKWALVGIVGLALMVLLWMGFKYTQTRRSSEGPTQPSGGTVSPHEPLPGAPASSLDQAKGLRDMFAPSPSETSKTAPSATMARAANTSTQQPDTAEPASPSTRADTASSSQGPAPSVSNLVAADLKEIEQTLAQARQDFMRPVNIT